MSTRRHNAALEEYRATACHPAYAACANTASISALEDIQNYPKDSREFKAAIVTMRQSTHTHSALEEAARVRISHTRLTKGGGETTDSDRVFTELAYERFLKPQPDVASSEYDNLHRASIDKTLECSLLASAKAAAGATFAFKTPDRPAPDRPAPNPTLDPNPSPSRHRETTQTPKIRSPRTPTRTHDGVTHRATSCNEKSNFMRHRVRNRASEWKRLGASEQALCWIRRGVRIPFYRRQVAPAIQQRHLHARRNSTTTRLHGLRASTILALRRMGTMTVQHMGFQNVLVPKPRARTNGDSLSTYTP
jgi:hypothetical protein